MSLFPMKDEFLLNGAEAQIDFYVQNGRSCPKSEPQGIVLLHIQLAEGSNQ